MEQKQIKCPECGIGVLMERKGSKGVFLGCSKYPECKHTESVEEAIKNMDKAKKGDYHLTPEQVRFNALDIVLRRYPQLETPALLREAETVEKWMLG